MTTATSSIALMAASPLPDIPEGADVPDWVHILPTAKGALQTVDGRGPYIVRDADAIIAASMADGEIPVDQDHAMGKAAARGEPAPARGWITAMQARDDGIWAKVRWTKEGAALVMSQAYRKISPVIRHLKNGTVISVREVSLVNRPNLRGLHALNQEGSEMLHEKLIELLGLEEGATEEQMLAAFSEVLDGGGESTAMQSALDRIADVVGLEAGASVDAIVTAAKAAKTAADTGGDQLTSMQAQIDELKGDSQRTKSEAFVDQAIRDGHAVPAADRDEYVSMHMEMPERAEKIIKGLPKLGRSHTNSPAPKSPAGKAGLSSDEAQVVAMMGQDPAEYAKLRDDIQEEAL